MRGPDAQHAYYVQLAFFFLALFVNFDDCPNIALCFKELLTVDDFLWTRDPDHGLPVVETLKAFGQIEFNV